jgi:plasmid maintenance system killer protein
LSGDRGGQYSIRINQQRRICFRWSDLEIEKDRLGDALDEIHPLSVAS